MRLMNSYFDIIATGNDFQLNFLTDMLSDYEFKLKILRNKIKAQAQLDVDQGSPSSLTYYIPLTTSYMAPGGAGTIRKLYENMDAKYQIAAEKHDVSGLIKIHHELNEYILQLSSLRAAIVDRSITFETCGDSESYEECPTNPDMCVFKRALPDHKKDICEARDDTLAVLSPINYTYRSMRKEREGRFVVETFEPHHNEVSQTPVIVVGRRNRRRNTR